MRSSIILFAISAAVLGGCASAYKTGQTPDDIYYSPQRPQEEYVNLQDNSNGRYYNEGQSYDDEYLRMKVNNRLMWSELDDWYYYNPAYSYSFYNTLNWNNPWSPALYWNYYYNPYCSPILIVPKGSSIGYNHPRIFNLNTYNNSLLTSNNYISPKRNTSNYSPGSPLRIDNSYVPGSTNNNRGSNTGNFLRNIFNNSSSSGNNNSTYNGAGRSSGNVGSGSSGSSRSSGGGGGSAPVRKF